MKKTYSGSCHCGRVRIEADLDLSKGTFRCNCSICTKTRAWLVAAAEGDVRVASGRQDLRDYQFGPMRLHHYFCMHCGVWPFSRGESGYAVRLACLDDVPPEELVGAPVQYFDMRHDAMTPPAETRHL
jgi:hypothetical protein